MRRYFTIPLLLMLLPALISCQRAEDLDEPTAGTFVPEYAPAELVSLSELAADPAAYRDQRIQLSGEFQPLPRIACVDSNRRTGPASWSVVADGWVAQAGGTYQDISRLLPTGLTVTVEGTWRLWSGPIGCGKRAQLVEMWYLEVADLLEPRPLVSMTLTPSGAAAAVDSPTSIEEGAQVAQAPTPTPAPGVTDGVLAANATPSPFSSVTPRPSFTPSPTVIGGPLTSTAPPGVGNEGTGLPSATPEIADENETPTPESSPTNGPSPTPEDTPGPGTPTFTPTATPGLAIVDMGDVGFHSLVLDTLQPGTRHAYTISVEAGTTITIGLVMPIDRDPVLKLVDVSGRLLVEKNDVGAGQVERLEGFVLENDGEYRLLVHDVNDREGDYTFTLDDGLSLDYLYFAGLLLYGDVKNELMPEDRLDFWHFYGVAGDEITISLTPNDSSDLRFLLLSPLFDELSEGFVDDRPGGQPEQAVFTLPLTGLYTIQVEEYYLLSSDYLVRLTKAP